MGKLRGGKRRLRQLERNLRSLPALDLEKFHRDQEFSAWAVTINPFVVRTPSASASDGALAADEASIPDRIFSPAVQRLLSEWLARTYLAWQKILEDELKTEAFFLEIWLDPPSLTKARVVCAKGERIASCQNFLGGPLDRREFPYHADRSAEQALKGFQWKQRQEPILVMANEFEELPHLYRMMEDLSYSQKISPKGEAYLLLPGRCYWAGIKA